MACGMVWCSSLQQPASNISTPLQLPVCAANSRAVGAHITWCPHHHHPTAAGYTNIAKGKFTQPIKHFETAESKRRLQNLLGVSGLLDQMEHIQARQATVEELSR